MYGSLSLTFGILRRKGDNLSFPTQQLIRANSCLAEAAWWPLQSERWSVVDIVHLRKEKHLARKDILTRQKYVISILF